MPTKRNMPEWNSEYVRNGRIRSTKITSYGRKRTIGEKISADGYVTRKTSDALVTPRVKKSTKKPAIDFGNRY